MTTEDNVVHLEDPRRRAVHAQETAFVNECFDLVKKYPAIEAVTLVVTTGHDAEDDEIAYCTKMSLLMMPHSTPDLGAYAEDVIAATTRGFMNAALQADRERTTEGTAKD